MTKHLNIIIERRLKFGKYIIRVDRIRKGKIQRRKLVSARKNYKVVKGKLVRMSTQEIRRRKIGIRRAIIKRRAKMSRAKLKRKISLLRGKTLNLYR